MEDSNSGRDTIPFGEETNLIPLLPLALENQSDSMELLLQTDFDVSVEQVTLLHFLLTHGDSDLRSNRRG